MISKAAAEALEALKKNLQITVSRRTPMSNTYTVTLKFGEEVLSQDSFSVEQRNRIYFE
jgi:hypothetical protein